MQKNIAPLKDLGLCKFTTNNKNKKKIMRKIIRKMRRFFLGVNLSASYWVVRPVVDFDEDHRMRVLKWSTSFSPAKKSSIVPVWISFPLLPNHLYNKSTLRILAKTIGNPLQIDDATSNGSRPSHPRVCIEFDCLKAPTEQIFVHMRDKKSGLNDGSFWQRVNFEKIPSYCINCHILGNNMATCKLLTDNQKLIDRMVEEEKIKADSNENAGTTRESNSKEKGIVQNVDKIRPLEKQTENQEITESVPYLTENWEIGNRRGKGEAASENWEIGLNRKDLSQSNFAEVCIPESANNRLIRKLEELVVVEGVYYEEEINVTLPKSGNPLADLPEKEGVSGKEHRWSNESNQIRNLSEKGQENRGVASAEGVAQEKLTEMGRDSSDLFSSGNAQEKEKAVFKEASNVLLGPPIPVIQKSEVLAQNLAQPAPKNEVLGQSFAHLVRVNEPKEQNQERFGSPSAKKKPSALDKDALPSPIVGSSLSFKQNRPSLLDAEDEFLLQQLESNQMENLWCWSEEERWLF